MKNGLVCPDALKKAILPAGYEQKRAPNLMRVSGQLLSVRRTTRASRVLDFPAQSTVRRGFTLGWRSVAEDVERAGQRDGGEP